MRISILGPLRVTGDSGQPVEVVGARLRTLLIRLSLDPDRTVSTAALIDAVWGDAPPAGAPGALQTLVSRLRRVLPDRLPAEATGYRLAVPPDAVDAVRFTALAEAGRRALAGGEPDEAGHLLGQALELWHGPALSDVADAGFARATADRLAEARLAATEDRIEAELYRRAGAELVSECAELVATHPLRERPYGLLMRALQDAGRSAEALRLYERLRRTLAEELGADPSAELAELHRSLLRGPVEARGNLPAPLTSFVGRDRELARLADLLGEERLVTLVGTGGAGKTRLALQVARAQLAGDGWPDGVWLVELAPVREPDEAPRAVAEALRLRFAPTRYGQQDLWQRLLAALADKRLLLVLDNCEHLVAECARLAEQLLGACPGVQVLATSREPLAITGETLCPVAPLSTPPADSGASQALSFPAVRLFADRAAAVRPGFAVDLSTVDAVVEICRRLDGLPLAIELATARLRTLPVDQIAARLGDRFRLLTGGSRTALPRHQTLQAVVEWSWSLLAPDERRLARRFSVFLDGSTVDGVEAVCAGTDLAALGGLVDKSLVTMADDRYRMLETIRAFAAEQLVESGEADAVRAAHARYFLDLAERLEPRLRGSDQLGALAHLSAEWENLNGALRWAVDAGDALTAVRIAGALGWFWALRSAHTEAEGWLSQALAVPGVVPPALRAVAQTHYAMNLMAIGDIEGSRAAFAAADVPEAIHPIVALSRPLSAVLVDHHQQAWHRLPAVLEHPDPWVRATGRVLRGALLFNEGNIDDAEEDMHAALEAARTIGDRWSIGVALASLSEPSALRGRAEEAMGFLRESLRLSMELGVDDDIAQILFALSRLRARTGDVTGAREDLDLASRHANLAATPTRRFLRELGEGEVARYEGDLDAAERAYRQALDELETLKAGPLEWRGAAVHGLARVALTRGDLAAASRYAGEVLDAAQPSGDRPILAAVGEVLAAIALEQGDAAEGARLLGLAEAVRGLPDLGSPEVAEVAARAGALLGDAYPEIYAAAARTPLADALAAFRASASAS